MHLLVFLILCKSRVFPSQTTPPQDLPASTGAVDRRAMSKCNGGGQGLLVLGFYLFFVHFASLALTVQQPLLRGLSGDSTMTCKWELEKNSPVTCS